MPLCLQPITGKTNSRKITVLSLRSLRFHAQLLTVIRIECHAYYMEYRDGAMTEKLIFGASKQIAGCALNTTPDYFKSKVGGLRPGR